MRLDVGGEELRVGHAIDADLGGAGLDVGIERTSVTAHVPNLDDVVTGQRVRLLDHPEVVGFTAEGVLGTAVGEVDCTRGPVSAGNSGRRSVSSNVIQTMLNEPLSVP